MKLYLITTSKLPYTSPKLTRFAVNFWSQPEFWQLKMKRSKRFHLGFNRTTRIGNTNKWNVYISQRYVSISGVNVTVRRFSQKNLGVAYWWNKPINKKAFNPGPTSLSIPSRK